VDARGLIPSPRPRRGCPSDADVHGDTIGSSSKQNRDVENTRPTDPDFARRGFRRPTLAPPCADSTLCARNECNSRQTLARESQGSHTPCEDGPSTRLTRSVTHSRVMPPRLAMPGMTTSIPRPRFEEGHSTRLTHPATGSRVMPPPLTMPGMTPPSRHKTASHQLRAARETEVALGMSPPSLSPSSSLPPPLVRPGTAP
jgi:hypothetical protein